MSKFKEVVVLFALASLCGAASGAPPPLRLADAVRLALTNNPELAAVHFDAEAAQARAAKAGTLPNPMLSFGFMDRADGGDWPDTNEKRIMLEQKFPWFGKRGLQRDVAASEVEGASHTVDSATLSLKRRVKETFFGLYAVRRSIEITREEKEVLRNMTEIATTLYAAGSRSQGDVFSAKSEATLLKQKIIELEAQEGALKAELNSLLNRKADAPVGLLASPPEVRIPDRLVEDLAEASRRRPEVLYALAMADRYGINKKLMEKESMPDYQLGVEYRSLGMDEDMVMLTVGIDLPIRRASISAGIRESDLMRESSLAAAKAAERSSDLEIQNAVIALMSARRTLQLFRSELIPQAQSRFKASEAGYRTGKTDFSELLESQRFLLSAKVDEAMTEGEVGKQAARLEQAAGINLMSEGADATERN